jgi:hypothetical protein
MIRGNGGDLVNRSTTGVRELQRPSCPGEARRRRKENASPSLANVCQRVPPVPWVSVGTYVVGSAEVKNLDEQIVIDLLCKDVLCPRRSYFVQSVGNFGKGRNRTD